MNVKKKDVVWTYLAKFFSLGVNLILLPMVMSFLTDTELALWYVFASISQVVNLFDFGFNATISRHMTYAWSGAENLQKQDVGHYVKGDRNNKLVVQVYHTCRIIYFIISICALTAMITLGSLYLYKVLGQQFTGEVIIAWIVYVLSVFFNLFYGYWSSLLQGIGAVAERNKMTVYAKCVQIIIAVVLLVKGYGLLGFVISYGLSGLSLRIIGRFYFYKYTKALSLKTKILPGEIKECISAIWFTAWKDGVVMLAQYLSTQANTLVCAYYVDLGATSTYGVITQIFSMIAAVACALYSSYQPALGCAVLQKDVKKQREIVCKTGFIYKAVFIVLTLAFIIAGIPVLKVIRPAMVMNIRLVIMAAVFYYFYQQHCLYCSMIAAGNKLPYYKSYLITAFFTILCSVTAAKYFKLGIWGMLGAQIITNMAYNNWKWPWYMLNELSLSYKDVWVAGFHSVIKRSKKT